jgi:hypothetical protein
MMRRRNPWVNAAGLAGVLLLNVWALEILIGGSLGALHALYATCGACLLAVWLRV